MPVEVLGKADIAGLDEFLGDDPVTFAGQLPGQPGGTITLSGIRIDAADEIDVIHIHKDLF